MFYSSLYSGLWPSVTASSERCPLGTSSHTALRGVPWAPHLIWHLLSGLTLQPEPSFQNVELSYSFHTLKCRWHEVLCVWTHLNEETIFGDLTCLINICGTNHQTYVYGLLLKFPAEIFMKVLSSIFYKIRSNWVISCYFSTSSIPHRLSNLHRIWLQTGVWLKSRSSPCCGLGASDGRVQASSSASNPRVPGGINIKIIHNGKKRKLTLSSFVYRKIIHPHNTMENIHNSLVLVITFTWNKIRQNENIERKFLLYANNKNGLI